MFPAPQGGDVNLSGVLLVATPVMRDSNFQKAIVLISAHDRKEGAIGIIINQPLDKTLGEYSEEFSQGPLKDVKVYKGGPIHQDQLILTAWQWDGGSGLFKLHFGIGYEAACDLVAHKPDIIIRGFLGYSGWRYNQLNDEISQDGWIIAPINEMALEGDKKEALWRDFIAAYRPELFFLAQAPNDPSLN